MYLLKCLIFFYLSQSCAAGWWDFVADKIKNTTETADKNENTTETTSLYNHDVTGLDSLMLNGFTTTMLPSSTPYEPTESTTEGVTTTSTTEYTNSERSTTVPTTIPTTITATPDTTPTTTEEDNVITDSTSTSTTFSPTVSSTVTDSTTTDSTTIFSSKTTEDQFETSTPAVTQSFPGNGPRAINGSNSDSGSNDPTNDSETDYTTESASETSLRSNETSDITISLVNNSKTVTIESTVNPEDEENTTNRNKYERDIVSTTTWGPSLDSNKNRNSTMEDTTTEVTTPMISVGSISETGEKQVKSSSFNSIGSNKFLTNLLSLLITLYIFC